MDVKDIKDLILTIDKTSIEKVEIEKNDFIIRINKRQVNESTIVKTIEKAIDERQIDQVIEPKSAENEQEEDNLYTVMSPMVGTFYDSPSPDSPPFVKMGDRVVKGQTLCIIEAMKMMNEVKCETEGEIVEILIGHEDIVEYGQPLMKIRR